MFNLFKGGIKDKIAKEEIRSLKWLEMHIRDNEKQDEILKLHKMYDTDIIEAKKYKDTFPYITPHGTFYKERLAKNIKTFSGYLYFDIDSCDIDCDVHCYIDMLKSNYSPFISVLGTSISGRGIFFYVRIENKEALNKQNFDAIHSYFQNEVFKDLPLDKKAGGIERAQFLPFDPNLYVNSEASISLSKDDISKAIKKYNQIKKEKANDKSKRKKQSIKCDRDIECGLVFPSTIDIRILLKDLKFKTLVEVNHPIVEFKPVEYFEYHPPYLIEDGSKHKIFLATVNALMYLNPNITFKEVYSYVHYLNFHRTARKPMGKDRLYDIIKFAFDSVIQTGELHVDTITKFIHFNPECDLKENEKKAIANKLNAFDKNLEALERIIIASEGLEEDGIEINTKNLMSLLGQKSPSSGKAYMSAPTLRKYYKKGNTLSDLKHQKQLIEKEMNNYIQSLTKNSN